MTIQLTPFHCQEQVLQEPVVVVLVVPVVKRTQGTVTLSPLLQTCGVVLSQTHGNVQFAAMIMGSQPPVAHPSHVQEPHEPGAAVVVVQLVLVEVVVELVVPPQTVWAI